MAPDSNILTWEIPWTEEPGRLQSMGVSKSQTPDFVINKFKYNSAGFRD